MTSPDWGSTRLRGLVVLVAAALSLAGCSRAEPGVAGTNQVFATNEFSGDLSIVDGSSGKVLGTYPLGKRPRGLKLSPDGSVLYVALSGSPVAPPGVDESKLPPPDRSADGIGVFDLGSHKLLRVLRGIVNPEQLAVSPEGLIYAGSEDAGAVVIFDPQERKPIGSIPVGDSPEGVALSPDGHLLYVALEDDNKVAVVDAAERRVIAKVPVGQRPRSIAFSSDGTRAYVTEELQGAVTEMDTDTRQVLRTFAIPGKGAKPMGVVVSPNGSKVYITTGRGGTLVAIDVNSGMVSPPLAVGARPWGVALRADGRRLYTANGPSDDMTIVDTSTMKVVGKVPLGRRPWGVAAAPAK